MSNQLFYGDNLYVLRESVSDESIDLIYLDPPFNSKRDYNLLFRSPKGLESKAQIEAFEDTWHWNEQAEREFDDILHQTNTNVAEMMKAVRGFLGENDMMAYLTMMANRLLELHRVLKSTGSLYLHCDPTASHYLKLVLDGVFRKENYQNEIIWKRTSAHNDPNKYGKIHDTIFFYTKSANYTWNVQYVRYDQDYIDAEFRPDKSGKLVKYENLTGAGKTQGSSGQPWRGVDPGASGRHWAIPGRVLKQFNIESSGLTTQDKLEKLLALGQIKVDANGNPLMRGLKTYLDELPGMPLQSVWSDVEKVGNTANERLGYPTQKPLALLERIIAASSNKDDVVLDPFCGCGTAVHAAQRLKRRWIGIDITHLAISLIEKRLKDAFKSGLQFEVYGTPKDLDAARDLASRDKYQFQWWAVSLVDAQPFQGKKKGADPGIDGIKFFRDLDRREVRKIVVSVKGGENLKADDVRSVMAVREREKADIALFISLEEPTRGMIRDAASAGFYESRNGKKYPRIQLLSIEGLLSGNTRAEHPDYEPDLNFKKATTERLAHDQELGF